MATKKYFDDNGVLYLWNKIKSTFVLQESGKGLSTNDLTNELKNKYDNVVTKVDELTETGGEPNVIETIKVNGAIQTVTNKTVDISVPTVDSALSSSSTNPVQNKVINTALGKKQDTLVSGTNVKTVNGFSLLGSGDISGVPTLTGTVNIWNTNNGVYVAKKGAKFSSSASALTEDMLVFIYGSTSSKKYVWYFTNTLSGNEIGIDVHSQSSSNGALTSEGFVEFNKLMNQDQISDEVMNGLDETYIPSVQAVYNALQSYATSSTLTTELAKKVDKVTGKGLSTNDYTTTEKNKLSGISSGAEVNKIDSIKVNGTAQTISSKAVNITVPTNNNQLTNGAGYQTESQVKAIVEGVVGSAPDLLNTLDELAQALGDDPNFATTMTTELAKKVNETDLVAITNAEIDTIIAS